MSRTNKDTRARKELNEALRSKRSGPHKSKFWKVCPACRGGAYECNRCKGDGIVYE